MIIAAALLCTLCTPAEKEVINVLSDYGIKDKNAVAVILGNIKQESNFKPLACEEYTPRVARDYQDCYMNTRGGFGLIQWTSEGRIKGLGTFCTTNMCNPNTISGQMRYLVNEYDFQLVKNVFTTPGLPLQSYKDASFSWIRWGVTGHRWNYTADYLNKLTVTTTV